MLPNGLGLQSDFPNVVAYFYSIVTISQFSTCCLLVANKPMIAFLS
jgi:hypothetical protein